MSVDPRAFVLSTAAAFAAVDEPHATPLVATGPERRAVIPAGGTMIVYGADGAGKTTWLIDLAVHLAAGDSWLDLLEPTRPLTVALLENEGVRAEFRRKLRDKLAAWDGSALDGRLLVFEQPWGEVTLRDELHRDELAWLINEHQVDLLIAGPLADLGVAGPGTPADVSDFGELLALLRNRCERPLAIAAAHHENRAGQMSGAWGRLPDTVAHVQPQGNGSLRIFWHKVRNASSLHKTTTKLVWAEGMTFAIDDREPVTEDRVREEMLAFARLNGGKPSGDVDAAVKGNAKLKRDTRKRLVAEGALIELPGQRGAKLIWHPDDPAIPARPLMVELMDEVTSAPEDGTVNRPRPSVLDVVEDGRGRTMSSGEATQLDHDPDEVERLAEIAREDLRPPDAGVYDW